MEYQVSITETLCRVVSVEASSAEEAEQIVWEQYNNCDIVLDSDDYIDTEIKAL